jgi:hypothetical protein
VGGFLAFAGGLMLVYFIAFPEDLDVVAPIFAAITPGVGIIVGAGIIAWALVAVWGRPARRDAVVDAELVESPPSAKPGRGAGPPPQQAAPTRAPAVAVGPAAPTPPAPPQPPEPITAIVVERPERPQTG